MDSQRYRALKAVEIDLMCKKRDIDVRGEMRAYCGPEEFAAYRQMQTLDLRRQRSRRANGNTGRSSDADGVFPVKFVRQPRGEMARKLADLPIFPASKAEALGRGGGARPAN